MQTITIQNGNLLAKLIPYGARLIDIRMKPFNFSLILGYPKIMNYLKDTHYMGAIVGRVANRIDGAQAIIGELTYTFDNNEYSKQTLHGGTQSCAFQKWRVYSVSDSSATFILDEPDGHMGFPGNFRFEICYEIKKPMKLQITMQAISDKDGICNLTSHPYFCLDDTDDISGHKLKINATHYLPVNDFHIPTGNINTVSNSQFNFLKPTNLSGIVEGKNKIIDHNFCISDSKTNLREVATLSSRVSCIKMRVLSTEPGLQVYTGHHLSDTPEGYKGRPYTPFSGLCLEPQGWPDAPNKENFPSIYLPANTLYQQTTCYEFENHKQIECSSRTPCSVL